MIISLRKKDYKESASLYRRGLNLMEPLWDMEEKNIIEYFRSVNVKCFISKNKTINGLVSFKIMNNKIIMDFICSFKKGVGSKLMKHLIKYAKLGNIKYIYSKVSSIDKRAKHFYYNKFNFKKYDEKYNKELNFTSERIRLRI